MLRLLIFFILFSNNSFGQWKSFYPEKKNNKKVNTSLNNLDKGDQDLLFNTIFFNGVKQKSLENYEESLKIFQRCIKMRPDKSESYYQASFLSLALGYFNEALSYSKKSVEISPENKWYLRNYIDVIIQIPDYKLASEQLLNLIKLEPNNEVNFFQLADTYIYSKNYNKAIGVYNKLEKLKGIDKMTSMQKQKLYMQMKNLRLATREIVLLSEKFPADIEILEILAESYLLNNEQEKAFNILKKISLINPENGQVHLRLANFYRDKNDNLNSYNELKLAFKSSKVSLETKISIIASYFPLLQSNDTIKSQAFELSLLMIEKHPLQAQVYAIHADLLFSDGKKNAAKEFYKKTLNIDKNFKEVWTQLLFLEIQENNFDSLLDLSFKALSYYPIEPLYYYFYAISNLRKDNLKLALDNLNIGLEFVIDNKALKLEFHTSLAETYHLLQMHLESDSIFEVILIDDPENILVLNNYSYYLSLRNERLDIAKKMSYKCNLLEPNNGTYEDTYAWILYCLGDFEEARKWIEKSLDNNGNESSVIVEHYGDILYELKFTELALEQWNRAFILDSSSESLKMKISKMKIDE